MEKMTDKQLLTVRQDFMTFMAIESKDLAKATIKTKAAFFAQKINTLFDALACVGYNPNFSELTATVRINKATGYSGNLCTQGSMQYVRFYLNYEDGDGWQDLGLVALNGHDLLTKKDCDGAQELLK